MKTNETKMTVSELREALKASSAKVRLHFTAKGNPAWKCFYRYGKNDREIGTYRLTKKGANERLAEFGLTANLVVEIAKAIDEAQAAKTAAMKESGEFYTGGRDCHKLTNDEINAIYAKFAKAEDIKITDDEHAAETETETATDAPATEIAPTIEELETKIAELRAERDQVAEYVYRSEDRKHYEELDRAHGKMFTLGLIDSDADKMIMAQIKPFREKLFPAEDKLLKLDAAINELDAEIYARKEAENKANRDTYYAYQAKLATARACIAEETFAQYAVSADTIDAAAEAEIKLAANTVAEIEIGGYDETVFELLPTVDELNDTRSDIEKEFDEFDAEDTDRDARFNRGERYADKLTAKLRKFDATAKVTYDINEDDEDVFFMTYDGIYGAPCGTLDAAEEMFHAIKKDQAEIAADPWFNRNGEERYNREFDGSEILIDETATGLNDADTGLPPADGEVEYMGDAQAILVATFIDGTRESKCFETANAAIAFARDCEKNSLVKRGYVMGDNKHYGNEVIYEFKCANAEKFYRETESTFREMKSAVAPARKFMREHIFAIYHSDYALRILNQRGEFKACPNKFHLVDTGFGVEVDRQNLEYVIYFDSAELARYRTVENVNRAVDQLAIAIANRQFAFTFPEDEPPEIAILSDELDEIGNDICDTKDILERKIAAGAPQSEIKELAEYIAEREGEYYELHKQIYGTEPESYTAAQFDVDAIITAATVNNAYAEIKPTAGNTEFADKMATLETVINKLKAEIERGDSEFTFPTVDELTAPDENEKARIC